MIKLIIHKSIAYESGTVIYINPSHIVYVVDKGHYRNVVVNDTVYWFVTNPIDELIAAINLHR